MILKSCGVHVAGDLKENTETMPEFPIACYDEEISEAEVDWHWHEEFELIQVQEGKINVLVGETSCVLGAGEGIFINGNILHAVKKVPGEIGHIHSEVFHPRLIGGTLESVLWQKYIYPVTKNESMQAAIFRQAKEWNRQMLAYGEAVWNLCREESDGYEFQVREALSQVIFHMNRHCGSETVDKKSKNEVLRGERVRQMLQYIHEHFGEAISGKDIADSANISVSESLRCFQKMIGTSPLQYVKRYRLEQAEAMLRTQNRKIGEVAYDCGFHDMSYFAREFRKMYGHTPSEYVKAERS